MNKSLTVSAIALALAASLGAPAFASNAPIVGLITKTEDNPFFVSMKKGAEQRASEVGAELWTYAGSYDGDVDSQIAAVEELIGFGANGILISPSDPVALTDVITRAREAGILVIALDTPFSPATVADATFATDNYRGGELIGQWAAAQMGDTSGARIATLDLSEAQISVDVQRNQGFLSGFGVDVGDPEAMYDEADSRIVGSGITLGSEAGGMSAMSDLLAATSDINVVYTINEPAAIGAYQALEQASAADGVSIVSVDGGCPAIPQVAAGVIDATAMQFPLRMATYGVDAIVEYAASGNKPENSPGLDFFNTGVELVTDTPIDGVPSISSVEAMELCWG